MIQHGRSDVTDHRAVALREDAQQALDLGAVAQRVRVALRPQRVVLGEEVRVVRVRAVDLRACS